MFYDGLEDAYYKGRLMGTFAEDCAQKYQFSREAQDDFAIHSLQRAQKANREGWFAWEITPLAVKPGRKERSSRTTSRRSRPTSERSRTRRRRSGRTAAGPAPT